MLEIGTRVHFCSLSGHVRGYTVCKRQSHADKLALYAIIELDPESSGYMENHTSFISMMLVEPSNLST